MDFTLPPSRRFPDGYARLTSSFEGSRETCAKRPSRFQAYLEPPPRRFGSYASAHSISFFLYRGAGPILQQTQAVGPHKLAFPHRNPVLLHDAYSSCLILGDRLLPTSTARISLPRHNSLKKRLTSRSFLRVALRRCLLSRVQRPCLKLPLRAPDGPPEPLAPPCIRQRARPLTAACRQGRPVRVLAPQRGALAILASRRSMSA